MQYIIERERLNNVAFPILDEIYGVLSNKKDKTRYFDEYGDGRVHVRTRKKTGYILFSDFKKMKEELDLPQELWFEIFLDWFENRYGVRLDPELAWLSYSL